MTIYEQLQALAGKTRPVGIVGTPRSPTTPAALTPPAEPGRGYLGNAPAKPPPPVVQAANQQLPVPPAEAAQRQIQQELDDEEKRRVKGVASTLVTGSGGLLSSPSTARRTLIGA